MQRRHRLNFNGFRRSIRWSGIALLALRITLSPVGIASALSLLAFTSLLRRPITMPMDTVLAMADAGHVCYPSPVNPPSDSYMNAAPSKGLLSTPPLQKLSDALRDGRSIPQIRDLEYRHIEAGG